jgi:hypothetical protein
MNDASAAGLLGRELRVRMSVFGRKPLAMYKLGSDAWLRL